MANVSNISDFITCGSNWTGPTMGETGLLSTDSVVTGYIACVIAVLFYGSNFVPFKFVDAKDGIFAQWVMCVAIWFIGLVIHLARQQPVFFPWTLLGGAIWAIGNCCTVPIINLIGLSLGILIWNSVSVVVGWATGRFGMLGLCPEYPRIEAFNYTGVVLCIFAGVIYTFIKSETKSKLPACLVANKKQEEGAGLDDTGKSSKLLIDVPDEDNNLDTTPESVIVSPGNEQDEGEQKVFLGHLPVMGRRILGVVMALSAGVCYGTQFTFAISTQHHTVVDGVRASQNGLDYVFSQFCGILLGSSVVFVGYAMVCRRRAVVKASLVLPSIISGLMWGIATGCFFVANATLGAAISFPIIMPGPGMIATLWGVFLFGEIRGWRNLLMLCVAASLTISGGVFTALSK